MTAERTTVNKVPTGLKTETKTGPLFFIAQLLKLTHAPLTIPAYYKPHKINRLIKYLKSQAIRHTDELPDLLFDEGWMNYQ